MVTPHGVVQTPVFMPVGTAASVKSLSPDDLGDIGAQIILGNTYHLYLRPGEKLISEMGGLHDFMGWNKPILTDSGGFQVMSLSKMANSQYSIFNEDHKPLAKVTEEGVEFRSHLDGLRHFLTPEKSVEIQEHLEADIIMAFDQGTFSADKRYTKAAMERTHRWLVRSKKRWEELEKKKQIPGNKKQTQALFGIIQGGKYKDLRQEAAKFVVGQDLPGIALGGESIGSDAQETAEVISWVRELLPRDKPLYTLGVGVKPSDLVAAVKAGADMFDCVAPTRLARTGLIYHPEEKGERISIGKAQYAKDKKVIWDDCDCYTCKSGFSRGYLNHLFRSRELLYFRLASIHNLRVMIRTVQNIFHD